MITKNEGVRVRIVPTYPDKVALQPPMCKAIYEEPQNKGPITALRRFLINNHVEYGDIFATKCTGEKRTCDYMIFIFVLGVPKRNADKVVKRALKAAFKKAKDLNASEVYVQNVKIPGANWAKAIGDAQK